MNQRKMYIRTAYMFLTHKCPLNCSYCYIDKSKTTDITYDIMDKFIENIFPQCAGGCGIIFFGGEPLLRIDLIEELAKKREYLFKGGGCDVVTSASVNMDRYFKLFEKYEIATQISYDGLLNNNTRKRKFDFSILNDFIQLSKTGKRKFQFRKTVSEDNIDSLFQDYLDLSEVSIKNNLSFDFSVVHQEKFTIEFHNKLYKNLTMIWNVIRERIRKNEPVYMCMTLLEDLYHIKYHIHEPISAKLDSCEFGHILIVDCDGSLYPCTMLSQVGNDFKIGDVNSGIDFDKLDYLKRKIKIKCDCHYSQICGGGCVWERYKNFGLDNIDNRLLHTCRNTHIRKMAASEFLNSLSFEEDALLNPLIRLYGVGNQLRFDFGMYSKARKLAQEVSDYASQRNIFITCD